MMRYHTLLLSFCLLLILGVGATQAKKPADCDIRDVLGAVHVAGRYHLTDKDFLNEGADEILALGSRVIKIWFYGKRQEPPQNAYPYNSDWPEVSTLVEGAKTPYYQALFTKPFTTYIMVVTSLGRDDGYWRDGVSDAQKQDEEKQFYELTRYLLTTYQGTGKTFVLQHWEGDWMVRGHVDGKLAPTEAALNNMIAWLNARQAGVDRAKREVGQDGVHVYHATEVNRVVQSMREGKPNMVNRVLPHTHLDMVSYSAWDSATEYYRDPNVFRDALDFIAQHMPDSADFGDRNVYLGEFGMPENLFSAEQVRMAVSNAVETSLDWGCPYIVYWQLYCNEQTDWTVERPVKKNDAVRGFWLIRPDGTRSWVWHYFHAVLDQGSATGIDLNLPTQ